MRAIRVPYPLMLSVPFWFWMLLAAVCLCLTVMASIFLGSVPLPPDQILLALGGGADQTTTALVMQRADRTVLGLMVGLALGLAGSIMQALTRNPLADPGVLGVNAGASCAMVLGVVVGGFTGVASYIWCSLCGAFLTTVCIYAFVLSGRSKNTGQMRLLLVGMAVSSVLLGISQTLTLLIPTAFEARTLWGVGTLANRPQGTVGIIAPFIVVGVLAALSVTKPLGMLAAGDDLAVASGVNLRRTQAVTLFSITLLCGAATAACGPLAFVGLLMPLAARALVGTRQLRVTLLSAFLSPVLLVAADILGRVVSPPREVQAGIVVSVLGSIVLLVLIRRSKVNL